MRIVVATERLARVGGTETYVVTVAEQLQRLGHQVNVYSPHLGDMAHLMRGRGVDVFGRLEDLGEPDVVLAQDAATSYELAGLWPKVPQVYVSHSNLYDIQQPPLVRGTVQVVVVMNDRIAKRVGALAAELRVVRMRQPIDFEWLTPSGEPAARPRRALLLGNYLESEARRLLVDTWSELGVEVVQVGSGTTPTLRPQDDIARADIVVGRGRAVLDAMACGRPAYLYDMHGGDGWVTAASYDAIEADGFAGHALPGVADAARLRRDLAAYDPFLGQVGRQLVLKHHDARAHANDLTILFEGLVVDVERDADLASELARQVRLRWRAEGELINVQASLRAMGHELAVLRDEVDAARAQGEAVAEAERALRASVEQQRDLARVRGRRLRAREMAYRQQRWVRLGEALRLARPR